ncbi:MAG: hypothetical protein JW967_04610 [Dehalococcoidales bacterium]|nr:hypothetical protein [Dehalococcoidales bacterium]
MVKRLSVFDGNFVEKFLKIPYIIPDSVETILERADSNEDDYEPLPEALTQADNSEMIENKVDAQAILSKLPKRLIEIAQKRVDGYKLTPAEQVYLLSWRKKLKPTTRRERQSS